MSQLGGFYRWWFVGKKAQTKVVYWSSEVNWRWECFAGDEKGEGRCKNGGRKVADRRLRR